MAARGTIFILGARKTGKSELADKLSVLRRAPITIVFRNPLWDGDEIAPPEFVYHDIAQLSKLIEKRKAQVELAYKRDFRLPAVRIVVDNLVYERDGIMDFHPYEAVPPLPRRKDFRWENSQEMREFLPQAVPPVPRRKDRWENSQEMREFLPFHRYFQIEFVLTSEYTLIQEPRYRVNLGYVFIFVHALSERQLDYAFDLYCRFVTKTDRPDVMRLLWALRPHETVVIDNVNNKLWWYDTRG